MIGKLKGVIDEIGDDHVLVDVHGVCYVAFCSARTLSRIGSPGEAVTLVIETFVRAEAAGVVPFRYTALVWGMAIGFVVWGDIPSGLDWLGILLIVGSGIYIVHREALRRRAST